MDVGSIDGSEQIRKKARLHTAVGVTSYAIAAIRLSVCADP